MNISTTLGPFQNYINRLPSPGKGGSIDPDVISLLLREVDCVEYSDNFLNFINIYFNEIVISCDVAAWIISSAVTNLSRERPGYKAVVDRLIEAYNENLFSIPIKQIDIDSILYFIGILIETDKSAIFPISVLTANLFAFRMPQEIADVMDIISNHRFTLDKIYALPDMDGIKYSLDDAIQALS